MKIRLLILFLALSLLYNITTVNGQTPVAVKGILDLRHDSIDQTFEIRLNGEWEFFWNKMLHPHDFTSTIARKADYYGKVPSYWTDYPQDKIKTEKKGFATYRLTILLPSESHQSMGFDIPVFDSAYDLYINGEYMTSNGIPGTNAAETKAEYSKRLIRYTPVSDTIVILINVSNYEHRRGGFWLPMKFGVYSEVQKNIANSWARDWAIISLLLGFSFFFLVFFILYPKDRISGFFSMGVIGLALRPLFTSHFLVLNFINLS